MTVSTINSGVSAELRRTQDSIKQQQKPLPYQPSGATLPEDVVPNAPVASRPAVADAVTLTAAQNRDAAQAVLTEADFDQFDAARQGARDTVANDPKASVAAQANNLPPKILDLLAE